MEKIINIIRQKSKECNKNTKEDRARKGAYVDCIVLLEAYQKDNSNQDIYLNEYSINHFVNANKTIFPMSGKRRKDNDG